jgi:trehalose-6-phosphate synthase
VGIILVSNRVAFPQANTPIQGGVASALLDAVEKSGAIWVGSSGRLSDDPRKQAFAEIRALGTGALATLDLPREHYTGFYEGFANSGLWPVLHSRPDLVRASEQDYASYCAINRTIARGLMRFNTDSLFWIHDYHFLTLGQELRRLGTTQPIGFFLHTPFPQRSIFAALPRHRELVKAMLAYDLLGFQTEEDQENFANYVKRELGLENPTRYFSHRNRCTRVCRARNEGRRPAGSSTAACQPVWGQTGDRCRPHRLLQRAGEPLSRFRSVHRNKSAFEGRTVASANSHTFSQRNRDILTVAEGCGAVGWRDQRQAR